MNSTNPILFATPSMLPSMNVACKSAVDILDDLITFDKVFYTYSLTSVYATTHHILPQCTPFVSSLTLSSSPLVASTAQLESGHLKIHRKVANIPTLLREGVEACVVDARLAEVDLALYLDVEVDSYLYVSLPSSILRTYNNPKLYTQPSIFSRTSNSHPTPYPTSGC